VDNRAEPSLAEDESALDATPAESEDGDVSSAAESASDAAASRLAASTEQVSTEASPATPSPDPAPAYASSNGSSATSHPEAPPAPAAGQPVTSLMAPPPSSPGSSTSIQDAAMAAMAGAASSAKGVASRLGQSFASLTKPRPRSPGLTAQPQYAPRPAGQAAGQWQRPQPARAPGVARPPQPGPPPRTALLSLQRVEPLSVMKFSSLIALVGWVVLMVAVAVVWFVLSRLGVFTKIEQTIGLVTYTKSHPGSDAAAWFSAKRVLGYTALVGVINAFLFTALATVGAALYNLITSLTGGIEVTLKETD